MIATFNPSAWALRNRFLVGYLMLVCLVAGIVAYQRLGQSEDPPFTFKIMFVRTSWPGASAVDVSEQISDRIEKAVMETGRTEYVRSYSRNGESVVLLMAKDAMATRDLPQLWYTIRKKIADLRPQLPEGIRGPYFNDDYGDTFGNIYALTADGFDLATMKEYAERIEIALQRVPDVGKIELLGLQDERIWVEISNARVANLGLPIAAVRAAIAEQNAVASAGFFETGEDRVLVRVDGAVRSVDDVRAIPLRVGQRTFVLGDVATVHRGYADPASPRMRVDGHDAVGIAVSMRAGGDILALGRALDATVSGLAPSLPAGLTLHKVSDQPASVRDSIGEFVRSLAEAIVIVLAVCFVSLGRRAGMVVALSIPLVLAMTFAVMHVLGIGLHKISLGALILALGLLVDDAIIAIEMMAVKIGEGMSRLRAASFAYRSTAFPMLSGTLVTAAGFLPIATASSTTGEFTRSIFQVVVIALLLSWIVAVVFIPWLGDLLLPSAHPRPSRFHDHVVRGQVAFERIVSWCVDHAWRVILITLVAFLLSLLMFRFVPRQFFPNATRLELMADFELADGASLEATAKVVHRFEADVAGIPELASRVCYVGAGSPRFYLPLDQKLPRTNFAQCVLTAHDLAGREVARERVAELLAARYGDVRARVTRLENGPPVGFPVQFRISGEHIDRITRYADQVRAVVLSHPDVRNVHLDWEEPVKVVKLRIDQARARALGVSTASVAAFLDGTLNGAAASVMRENNESIEVRLRGSGEERRRLSLLGGLLVPTTDGRFVSIDQIGAIEYGFEPGTVWRRNRLPTITVRADVVDGVTPAAVTAALLPDIDTVRASLPTGYLLETGGTVEDAGRGARSVAKGVPFLLLVVVTLLVLQLRRISRVLMVLATAPLGLIGVVLFLLVMQVPFGFVAMLGTIALSGMIMRNSIILVDQIDREVEAGTPVRDAVVGASSRRLRPIVLTALAAILAMLPLSRSVFFGPMAVAIMGGLIVATGLTLLFLPALYAICLRPRKQHDVLDGRWW